MPKVSKAGSPPDAIEPSASLLGTHPNVLKRNQACHQCRRRKMKCDAKRPCSTCVRSHAHAALHASPGTVLPAQPECTFDAALDRTVAETTTQTNESPKTRYERLENRINELMALLMEKEKAEAANAAATQPPQAITMKHEPHLQPGAPAFAASTSLGSPLSNMPNMPNFQPQSARPLTASPTSMAGAIVPSGQIPMPTELGVVWPNWPAGLPEPDLLRHLVDVFFVFHPHASRLFHTATFMATLSLPPTHPKYPATPVLHAICAMGSLYTAAVTSPPLPNFDEVEPDEIFQQRNRIKENRPDSFAEQQAKLAQHAADQFESLGESMFQVLQARLILSWFYWSHSRWRDVFVSSARTLRIAGPLALNICPPFHSITNAVRPFSILPTARTVIEDEVRRNSFWLMYAIERQHGSGNGWSLCLDDEDISQLLPVRGDLFEQGVLVPPRERQWAHSRNLLLHHPETQTDSFILYIKGSILTSHVKTFNLRFRARHFAGDASVLTPKDLNGSHRMADPSEPVDPRGSQAFMELDRVVSSFRSSFPSHLKNPINNNVVDNHLYTACLMPHAAAIVLHDPHADVRRSGCISALKILTGARAVLDLIYGVKTSLFYWVCSTSYDISLLDPFCIFCWFISGRVLVRFLRAALDSNANDQAMTFRNEIDFIQLALARIGERLPLAYRFSKILGDLVTNRCGPSLPPATSQEVNSHATQSTLMAQSDQDAMSMQRYFDGIPPMAASSSGFFATGI